MSIYIGNDLKDRLEALETENALLRKYNEYHQVVHEIDHMSDLHIDSSFHKQSMKLDNYVKIEEWLDSFSSDLHIDSTQGGHSITKHTGGGGWLKGLNQKPELSIQK